MRESSAGALAHAREVLARYASTDTLEKTLWSSPAGKKRLAKRLAAMLPAHQTYVEPFAGSAAVLFAKAPAPVEAINDADPDIVDAYRLIKKLTPAGLARLKKLSWVGDEKTFKTLLDAKPTDEVERLHRFLYVTHFSYGKMRGRSFSPSSAGVEATTMKRLERFAPRLRHVAIYGGDYEQVVRQYDGKDTAFFLDPPYAGYNVKVGEADFDEARFAAMLRTLKGKFLITYGVRGRFPKMAQAAGYWTKRIRTPRTISSMRGVGGAKMLTQLLVANYEPTTKALGPDVQLDAWDVVDAEDAVAATTFATTTTLVKGLDPNDERYVLGVVLEPEVVDAQDDIYSAAEIRGAAHRFMAEFGGLGLMHRLRVNGQVKVLESYLAPTDFMLGDVSIRKGTWMLAVRVLADELWERVKAGELTGFSIGGHARRVPELAVDASGAAAPAAPHLPPPEAA